MADVKEYRMQHILESTQTRKIKGIYIKHFSALHLGLIIELHVHVFTNSLSIWKKVEDWILMVCATSNILIHYFQICNFNKKICI
jgi:hypothetical protein